jgi:hypothetical protein
MAADGSRRWWRAELSNVGPVTDRISFVTEARPTSPHASKFGEKKFGEKKSEGCKHIGSR